MPAFPSCGGDRMRGVIVDAGAMPLQHGREAFHRRNLNPKNLSRCLEDAGTLTSPLVPWNTCGAYMQSVLLVPVTDYLFYAFFNLINPVLALAYAWLGIKVLRLTPPQAVATTPR